MCLAAYSYQTCAIATRVHFLFSQLYNIPSTRLYLYLVRAQQGGVRKISLTRPCAGSCLAQMTATVHANTIAGEPFSTKRKPHFFRRYSSHTRATWENDSNAQRCHENGTKAGRVPALLCWVTVVRTWIITVDREPPGLLVLQPHCCGPRAAFGAAPCYGTPERHSGRESSSALVSAQGR
eukprot:6188767-Pleurochrysis_carterae.AAC.1